MNVSHHRSWLACSWVGSLLGFVVMCVVNSIGPSRLAGFKIICAKEMKGMGEGVGSRTSSSRNTVKPFHKLNFYQMREVYGRQNLGRLAPSDTHNSVSHTIVYFVIFPSFHFPLSTFLYVLCYVGTDLTDKFDF